MYSLPVNNSNLAPICLLMLDYHYRSITNRAIVDGQKTTSVIFSVHP
jgi:hypothetical protein